MSKNLLVACLFVSGCASTANNSVQDKYLFDFAKNDPVDFLDFLCANVDYGNSNFYVQTRVTHWIRPSDISILISRLFSTKKCLGVMRRYSAYWPQYASEGDLAAYLISGFRSGIFPYRSDSRTYSLDEKNEIRGWWAQYQNASNSAAATSAAVSGIDGTSVDPIRFIESACSGEKAGDSNRLPQFVVKYWLNELHVPELIAKLDSTSPCVVVKLVQGSIQSEPIIERDLAASLIEGFRQGFYPPPAGLRSYGVHDINEFHQWWELYQEAMPLHPNNSSN